MKYAMEDDETGLFAGAKKLMEPEEQELLTVIPCGELAALIRTEERVNVLRRFYRKERKKYGSSISLGRIADIFGWEEE